MNIADRVTRRPVAIVGRKVYRDCVVFQRLFLDCLPRGGRILPRIILPRVAVARAVGLKELPRKMLVDRVRRRVRRKRLRKAKSNRPKGTLRPSRGVVL